jgi:hypothetical protein
VRVERFVLYDNASSGGAALLVRRCRFADRLALVDWLQHPAYRHVLTWHARHFDCTAFIPWAPAVRALLADGSPPHE